MGSQNVPLFAFNRGLVSKYALARVDLSHLRLAAETMTNWMPTVLGPMMLRPGLQYVGQVNDDLATKLIPFVFSTTDTAILEFTNNAMRVWNVSGDTETLVTRASVSTTVTNGDFTSATGWTETETGSGADVAINSGKLTMESPAIGGLAQAKRSVTVSGGDQGTEHAFRIVVDRGPVVFRCGSTDGDDDVVAETTLDTGTHSLAFTPSVGTIYIQLETRTAQQKIVDSITVEGSGVLELPTSFETADLDYLRHTQSGDVVFIACDGQQPRRIERRSSTSWSFVLYKPDTGPFAGANGSDITLTPSALTGNVTLTASRSIFAQGDVGSLIRLFSSGQTQTASLAAENTFSGAIRVSGVDAARYFNITRSGTWSGTLTLQRSFESATSGFQDTTTTYTTNGTKSSFDDGLDNSIAWYRIGFKTGDYTSGTADVSLTYTGGGAAGVGRITAYSSGTQVSVEVLTAFSSNSATAIWNFADWSDVVGWPSSVGFFDGRLFWAGRDKVWGSVSDDYSNFDPDYEGDAAPINRSVGFGPVDTINWLLPLNRLVVGRQGAETSIRSGSFDEPLTPTNFTLKDCSTQGSAAIQAVRVDTHGVFVQRSLRRVYELSFDINAQDYGATDLTRLNPELGGDGFADMTVRRQPDTELHFSRADGRAPILLHDRDDEVSAWWLIETDGEVEGMMTLPSTIEDRVYYVVKRTINGSTVRYIEKLARRDQCRGLPEARCADSHIIYDGSSTTSITGLDHLEGETVVVWGWDDADTAGKDLDTYTVSSGAITLNEAVENACIGLAYTADFKSAKLAYAAQGGTALVQRKKVNRIGLIMSDTHYQGLSYGQSFDNLDALPLMEDGATQSADTVHSDYDAPMTAFPGEWDTDARLCLRAVAPKPCTVLAAVIDVQTNE